RGISAVELAQVSLQVLLVHLLNAPLPRRDRDTADATALLARSPGAPCTASGTSSPPGANTPHSLQPKDADRQHRVRTRPQPHRSIARTAAQAAAARPRPAPTTAARTRRLAAEEPHLRVPGPQAPSPSARPRPSR